MKTQTMLCTVHKSLFLNLSNQAVPRLMFFFPGLVTFVRIEIPYWRAATEVERWESDLFITL